MIHLPAPRLCGCGVVHRAPVERDLARRLRPFDAMLMSNAWKTLALDTIDEALSTGADFGAVHTAYSATGANEVTGGSYARQALVWSGATGTPPTKSLTTFPTWPIPAGTTIAWWSGWDTVTVGNFLFMLPLGGGALKPFSAEASDLAGDTLSSPAHGFTAGQSVVCWGSILPAPLAVGTIYYVIAAGIGTDTLELSTSSGGSAVNITAAGVGFLQRIIPEVFGSAGTYALTSGVLDLSAIA